MGKVAVPEDFWQDAAKGLGISKLGNLYGVTVTVINSWLRDPKVRQRLGSHRGGILSQAKRKAEAELEDSIDALVDVRDNKGENSHPPSRVNAAKALIAMAEMEGKQKVEVSGQVRVGPLEDKTEAEIERIPFQYVIEVLTDTGAKDLAVALQWWLTEHMPPVPVAIEE